MSSYQIWTAIQSGAAWEDPSVLSKFIILTFAVYILVYIFLYIYILIYKVCGKYRVSCQFLITNPSCLGSEEIPVLLLVLLPCSRLLGRNSACEGSSAATAEILASAGELHNLISIPNFCLLWLKMSIT